MQAVRAGRVPGHGGLPSAWSRTVQAPTRRRTASTSRTGRTSMQPARAHGNSEAMRTASSMSSASISLKPPSFSLVSANVPSPTLVRPPRRRTLFAWCAFSLCWKATNLPSAFSCVRKVHFLGRVLYLSLVTGVQTCDHPSSHCIHVAHWEHLDAGGARPRELRGDAHRFVHVVGLDQVEAAQDLLGLGERAVHYAGAATADAHRLCGVSVLQLLEADQLALGLQLVGVAQAGADRKSTRLNSSH